MQSSPCGTDVSLQSRDLFLGQAARNHRGRTIYQGAAEREGGTQEALQASGAALPVLGRDPAKPVTVSRVWLVGEGEEFIPGLGRCAG